MQKFIPAACFGFFYCIALKFQQDFSEMANPASKPFSLKAGFVYGLKAAPK
ncbi:MAG: hypothetical protein N2491_03060 [Negativicutes bacterium]|nr:hypothetical protein [Negativicutes bacterium]